jgi:hypothetical protein
MSRLSAALLAIWDFVVGDDWLTALGVVVALSLTALIATTSVPAWWLMPIAVLVLLGLSLLRASRSARSRRAQ